MDIIAIASDDRGKVHLTTKWPTGGCARRTFAIIDYLFTSEAQKPAFGGFNRSLTCVHQLRGLPPGL
jgi:hypothetical protein